MWGYQRHFRSSISILANRIFDNLDPDLQPEVFLLGILSQEFENKHPVCFEPEDCGLETSWFENSIHEATNYEAIDEETYFIHSHPQIQEKYEYRLKIKALRSSIYAKLKRYNDFNSVNSIYCSYPILLEGYYVFVVLKLHRQTVEKYYSLNITSRDRLSIPTSLIEATINEYFRACERALQLPNPGSEIPAVDRNNHEIIQLAGTNLMYTPAYAGDNIDGLHGLFEACNTISSLTYEGAEGIGEVLIGSSNHPNIARTIEFLKPIDLHEYGAVRKILELCDKEHKLITDSAMIYGLGRKVGKYDARREDLFSIRFIQQHIWELLHDDHILMQVKFRQPTLPRFAIDEHKFRSDLSRIFSTIKPNEINRLWELTVSATKQKHGTLIVISEKAKSESERLENQSTLLKPIQLTPQLMETITAIDGAVLISPDSTCFAIGVILDGIATPKGTRSRGARYNSAIRYIESQSNCLAIVISEDGGVDLIPNLMPQISRLELLQVIERIKEIYNSTSRDRKTYFQLERFLRDREFYLSQMQCDELNSWMRKINDDFTKEGGIGYVYNDLKPHLDMNESYFLD